MSAIEMVIEKVKQLDELRARQLLTWLQKQERASVPARPAAGTIAQPDFLSRAKAIWGEHPTGKPLGEVVREARGGQP